MSLLDEDAAIVAANDQHWASTVDLVVVNDTSFWGYCCKLFSPMKEEMNLVALFVFLFFVLFFLYICFSFFYVSFFLLVCFFWRGRGKFFCFVLIILLHERLEIFTCGVEETYQKRQRSFLGGNCRNKRDILLNKNTKPMSTFLFLIFFELYCFLFG